MTENVQPGELENSLVHIQCGAHDQFTPGFPGYVPRFEPHGRIISGEPEVPA
jgi:hypothetical protein